MRNGASTSPEQQDEKAKKAGVRQYGLLSPITRPITADELVTLDELSQLTKIPPKTWRNWITTGKSPLPVLKVGKLIRFRGSDIVALIRGEIPEPQIRRRGRPTKADQIARQRWEEARAAAFPVK